MCKGCLFHLRWIRFCHREGRIESKKEKLGGYVTLTTMEKGNSDYMSGKNLNIICNFLTSIYVNVTYAEFNMMTKPECLDVLGLLAYGRT